MKRRHKMKITNHAVDRYCERIRPMPVEQVRGEMLLCFNAAKRNHRDRMRRKKNKSTVMVPTGCCLFVFDRGTMVTVLPREQPIVSAGITIHDPATISRPLTFQDGPKHLGHRQADDDPRV